MVIENLPTFFKVNISMKHLLVLSSMALFLSPLTASAEFKQSVVEGKIVKMVPSEREIYVLSEGKKYEYYFNKDTKVQDKGQEIRYDNLTEGQSVKVTANQIGKRLDPITVEIVE